MKSSRTGSSETMLTSPTAWGAAGRVWDKFLPSVPCDGVTALQEERLSCGQCHSKAHWS